MAYCIDVDIWADEDCTVSLTAETKDELLKKLDELYAEYSHLDDADINASDIYED